MKVTVTDRVPFAAEVTAEQVLAWLRRTLVGWTEEEDVGPPGVWVHFRQPGEGPPECRAWVTAPLRDAAKDWPRRVAELCDELWHLGVVARPSEALRGMAGLPPAVDALTEALTEMEDALLYVPDYFVNKYKYRETVERLRKVANR